jgi:hypothetical protein
LSAPAGAFSSTSLHIAKAIADTMLAALPDDSAPRTARRQRRRFESPFKFHRRRYAATLRDDETLRFPGYKRAA